jgi:hypothetical protein
VIGVQSNSDLAGSRRHNFGRAYRDQNHLEKGAKARGHTLAKVNHTLVIDGWYW